MPSCDPSLYFLQRAEDFVNFESSSLVNEVLEINYEEKENSRMHYLCIRNKDVKQLMVIFKLTNNSKSENQLVQGLNILKVRSTGRLFNHY